MADAPDIVTAIFDAQAQNYSAENIDHLLNHYAPDEELLFWSSEGARIDTHTSLKLWYEGLFGQFDVRSATYRVESVWESGPQIVVCSLWQFETRLRDIEDAMLELQTLKATHVLKAYGDQWKILHLHSSPVSPAVFE